MKGKLLSQYDIISQWGTSVYCISKYIFACCTFFIALNEPILSKQKEKMFFLYVTSRISILTISWTEDNYCN